MKFLRSVPKWEASLVVIIIVEILVFGAINPRFLDPIRLVNSTSDFVYAGMLALPLAMIMLSGGIDISFGSIVSLGAITTGVAYLLSGSMVVGMAAGLLAGLLAGLFNGALIVYTGTAPMVITLGTQFLFAGLALGVSGLGGVSAFEGISNLPAWFNEIGIGHTIPYVPNLLLIFFVMAALFGILLSRTTFGRRVRLLGMNPKAARYAGFNIPQLTVVMYSIMGVVAGIVGILLTAYFGSARPDIGATLLMPTLTLVVIGGVSMFGGEGSIGGVVLATFVIGYLQQGLRFAGMTENQVTVVTGIVLVVVASLRWWTIRGSEYFSNRRAQRREMRRQRRQKQQVDPGQDTPEAVAEKVPVPTS